MLTFLLLQAPQLGAKIQFFRVSCHGIMLLCYEEFVSFQPLTPVLTEPHAQACPPQRQAPMFCSCLDHWVLTQQMGRVR